MKSHDVRKLGVCRSCGGLADVVIAGRHPACIPVEELLEQPVVELGRIRICDVSSETMHKLLDLLAKRS